MKYKIKPYKSLVMVSCNWEINRCRDDSKKYNLKFLSSGLLYRYASFLILKYKPKNHVLFLKKKFHKLNYKKLKYIDLHSSQVSEHSAIIAKKTKIRIILKKFQLDFSKKNKNCCIEGRDI